MKIPFLISATFLSSAAMAQLDTVGRLIPMPHKAFEHNAVMAGVSLGFIDQYRTDFSLPAGFEKGTTSGFAPVFARLEYSFTDHFSLAGMFGYDAFVGNFKQVYEGANGPFVRYKTNNTRIVSGGISAFYHFEKLLSVRHLDPFIGLGLALNNIRYSALPVGDSTMVRIDHTVTPYLKAGARYYLTDKFSMFGDIGYDRHTALSIGFSVRILKNKFYPDTDADGVPDDADSCINAPGPKKLHCCPDSDGDGIKDNDDSCPHLAGLARFNGCPDSDGDGIPDKDDACPHQAGSPQFNGCPDSDGDGIADKDDECPHVAGIARFNGCPDSDGDGIPDKNDECPQVFGPVENHGCPFDTIKNVRSFELKKNHIEFQLGRSVLTPQSFVVLDEAITVIKGDPEILIYIDGYADTTGTPAINNRISKQRAETVKKYFIKKGIPQNRLIARGNGSNSPIGDNHTRAGRAKNRRVEMKIKYEDD